jgi:4-diphosphocytidyl-2-C-methyl-D-erythritol kinase
VSRALAVTAPAKVNLTLEVLRRRPDEYHEVAGVFATVDLRDRLRIASSRKFDVEVSPDVGSPPSHELAARAVRALADASGRAPHAYVRVKKRIPIAAGLAGGSSDAGAVLRALARLWRLDGVDLQAIAATVGSDVPFFASGAAFALVRGRGDLVDPLPPPASPLWIALVRLRERVSTAAVFAAHRSAAGDGARTSALAEAFRGGKLTPQVVRDYLTNDLLPAAERISPSIAEARKVASALGIELSLSGSGPSLFALANDRRDALRIARRLRRAGLSARAVALGVSS